MPTLPSTRPDPGKRPVLSLLLLVVIPLWACDDGDGGVVIEVDNLPPTALDIAVETPKNESLAATLPATDPDGDPLVWSIVGGPEHGTVTLEAEDAEATATYTPEAGFAGTDAVEYRVSDGKADATGTVAIEVIDRPPSVEAPEVVVRAAEGSVGVDVVVTDPDGDPLTLEVTAPPAHGTLAGAGSAPAPGGPDLGQGDDPQHLTLTYTPDPGFSGRDGFAFVVTDGRNRTGERRVEVVVNQPPEAEPRAVETGRRDAVTVELAGVDPDGDPLTFEIVTAPEHGALSEISADGSSGATVTYTPADDFVGEDEFTYRVRDALAASAAVGVDVTVVNAAPVARYVDVTLDPDNDQVAVTLQGSDPDDDPLTFEVVRAPVRGTLSGLVPAGTDRATVTYMADEGFVGVDGFRYRVLDGPPGAPTTATSEPVTVTVSRSPREPTADGGTVVTDEDMPVVVTLSGTDPDGSNLAFSVVAGPEHGSLGDPSLGGNPVDRAELTYTPDPDFNGVDALTFAVEDAFGATAAATVELTVRPVNDPPSFTAATDLVRVDEDAGPRARHGFLTSIVPGPPDETGQTVEFEVEHDAPALFAAGGGPAIDASGRLTFTPADDAFGTATVTVVAVDDGGTARGGADASDPFEFTLEVDAVNDPPTTDPASVAVVENEEVEITLTGADVEGSALDFAIATPPAHGTLGTVTSTGPESATVTYRPDADYDGPDSFTFTTDDGDAVSAPATVSVDVQPANARPSIALGGTVLIGPGDTGIEATAAYSFTHAPDPHDPDLFLEYAFGDAEGTAESRDDLWFQLRVVSAPAADGRPFLYLSPFDRSNDISVKEVRIPDTDTGDLGYVQWQSSLELANSILDGFQIRFEREGEYVLELLVLDNGRTGACPAGIEIPGTAGVHPDGIRSKVGRNGDLVGDDPERCIRESSVRITLDAPAGDPPVLRLLEEGSGG